MKAHYIRTALLACMLPACLPALLEFAQARPTMSCISILNTAYRTGTARVRAHVRRGYIYIRIYVRTYMYIRIYVYYVYEAPEIRLRVAI